MRTVILFGGSGFLGEHVVHILLKDPQVERVRILSRNEHRQAELAERWKAERVDFFVGDIRDEERVFRAIDGCHEVYHFAATKRVESCEYNPEEAVKTNVLGTLHIIHACQQTTSVEKAIVTSSDKAVEPIGIYGMSKALAEKLWIQGNIGRHRVKFAACRYGNVAGSMGSVLAKWKKEKEEGRKISMTDGQMTRFFISPEDAARFVTHSLKIMTGGEIFIPKMKSTEMANLAEAFGGETEYIARRPGEKMHEKLIADAEGDFVTETEQYFIRWPEENLFPVVKHGSPVSGNYTSKNADRFSFEELSQLCQKQ